MSRTIRAGKGYTVSMAPEQGIERFGDYVLIDRIATGGMAAVYSARALGIRGFSKAIAIKRIHPHLVERERFIRMFSDEAKIASKLIHPNIVQIYELGEADGQPYIAMELVPGCDLYQLVQRLSELGEVCPWPMAVRVAIELAKGLHHAHEFQSAGGHDQGIVHRDVSPRNILLSFSGQIKLTDFGVARARDREEHTEHGVIKGKVRYMSPEVALGKTLDRRSDLFSLGIVFAELLTMTPYRTGSSDIAILNSIRGGGISGDRFLALPQELQEVLQKALASDPDDRYATAADFNRDLAEHAAGPIAPMSAVEVGRFVRGLFSSELAEHRRREAQIDELLAKGINRLPPVPSSSIGRARLEGNGRPTRHGDLISTSLARLLGELGQQRMNGRLDLRRDPVEKSIYLSRGEPVFVESNVKRELFGEFLVTHGLLTRKNLEKAIGLSASQGLRLIDVLLRTKAIPPSELYQALASQVRERILNLFTWNEGAFEFYPDAAPPKDGMPLNLETFRIIHEGVTELLPLASVRRALGSRSTQITRNKKAVPRGLTLTGKEQRVLREIEAEPTTVAELCSHHTGEESVLRLVYLLSELDLVSVKPTP